MTLKKISDFLDENPCLSEAWKARLLTLLEAASGVHQAVRAIDIQQYMNFIEPHEGKRNKVYNDTMGHPTVGIGFNLDRPDALEILKSYGVCYDGIRKGTVVLSEEVIYNIFQDDVEKVVNQVRDLVSSFDEQPKDMKLVLVDMCFNLGKGGLSKFRNFLAAVKERNYSKAVAEMIDSRWYSQVGDRSKKLVRIVRSLV